MDANKIILPITPQSWVKIIRLKGGRGDTALFRIPEVCLKGRSKNGCVQYHRTGLCKHTLSKYGRQRKKRIERYNKYRTDLYTLAKQQGFELPVCGWSLYFYFPMPVRWRKWKKKQMAGQFHLQKPDESNLLKAFEDALSILDEHIGQMSGLGKFWTDQEQGFIEILVNQPVYNPMGVEFIDQRKEITMSSLKERREKLEEQQRIRREAKKKPKKKRRQKPRQQDLFKKEDNIK
jgi:Holliday junction resolvase RusA-like endonuclease